MKSRWYRSPQHLFSKQPYEEGQAEGETLAQGCPMSFIAQLGHLSLKRPVLIPTLRQYHHAGFLD